MEKFYITTTLPYVNADPHIGFALELVQADVLARYRRLKGDEVIFNTGTDEHGAKVYRRALEERKNPQAYVDEYAEKFERLKSTLNLSFTNFIRTTNPSHERAAQEFWGRCAKKGDIEKKFYRIKYCVGCELEKTDSELENGVCPIHPSLKLEEIEEENYFFKFSRYARPLLDLYAREPSFVVPDFRLSEIRRFVEGGLNDFSISRLREKMPWGVPVPGDDKHVMYVWFDALVSYVSTLGWPDDAEMFKKFWPGIQIAGKDNLRQQAAMWQAMLLSAGLPPSKRILIHGFITSGGEKMSKSLGNVVDPFEIVRRYGTDSVRYYLLREIPPFEDGDFTRKRFEERYNADLANGLGNFVARVLALAEKLGEFEGEGVHPEALRKIEEVKALAWQKVDQFRFHEALASLWELLAFGDAFINANKPWENLNAAAVFTPVVILDNIAALLSPFLPETAQRITSSISWTSKRTLKASRVENLFPRLAVRRPA